VPRHAPLSKPEKVGNGLLAVAGVILGIFVIYGLQRWLSGASFEQAGSEIASTPLGVVLLLIFLATGITGVVLRARGNPR
jgi:ABC-type branched-subunit amino acid transport system permease subunit